jgi:hypothetical protein
MATLKLRVANLEDGDASRLEEVSRSIEGVFGAVASPSAQCLELDLEDDEVDFDRILDRLRETGYDVRLSG